MVDEAERVPDDATIENLTSACDCDADEAAEGEGEGDDDELDVLAASRSQRVSSEVPISLRWKETYSRSDLAYLYDTVINRVHDA